MIVLTSCVGKIHYQVLANRTSDYLVSNNIIDSTTQKALLQSINGCIEDNQTVHEIIKNTKHNKRTAHITFFDLADAFGFVEHNLIYHSMEYVGLSPHFVEYIKSLYSNLNG